MALFALPALGWAALGVPYFIEALKATSLDKMLALVKDTTTPETASAEVARYLANGRPDPEAAFWLLLVGTLFGCVALFGKLRLSPLPRFAPDTMGVLFGLCFIPYFVLTVPSVAFQEAMAGERFSTFARWGTTIGLGVVSGLPAWLLFDSQSGQKWPWMRWVPDWIVKSTFAAIIPCVMVVLWVAGQATHVRDAFLIVVVPFLLLTGLPLLFTLREYVKEHPTYRQLVVFSKGGSARFGGIYSFLRYDFTKVTDRFRRSPRASVDLQTIRRIVNNPAPVDGERASMLMGETLFESDPKLGRRPIGLDTEAHMITLAMTGGGKSVFSAWNVLPLWPGGAFVLDPKGEHYQQTWLDRKRYGSVYVLDFWERAEVHLHKRASYNPLDAIDISDPNAREDLNAIVHACLPDEKDESANSAHFRENARSVMMGYIVHVMSEFPKEHHNLPAVYDVILTGSPDGVAADPEAAEILIDQMAVNEAVGKAPMSAAKILRDSGDREGGGYKTTVLKGLEWASGERFRQYLTKSDFSMRDVQDKRNTVFFVISIDDIRAYSRFVQIMVNQGFLACRHDAPHDKRTLFMLDEFAQLGTFKSAKEGLVTLRSRGIKLWLLNQHLGQLKESYGDADAFLGQCDIQAYAVNDYATAEAVSKRLGEYTERWMDGAEGSSRSMDKTYALRTPSEVMEDLGKGSKIQYLIPADGAPMRLKLTPFSKRFVDRTGFGKNGKSA